MSDINVNFVKSIEKNARYFPRNEAFIYGEKTWTYQDFFEYSENLAKVLAELDVKSGDRVAYLGLNSISFMSLMVSCWWLGAVYEPFNFRLAPHEVNDLVDRSRPSVLFVEPSHLELVEICLRHNGELKNTTVVVIDNDDEVPLTTVVSEGMVTLSTALDRVAANPAPEIADLDNNHLALLLFTSGTTGLPKGVQLTHGNLWWNTVNVDSLVDTRRGDTNLAVAPLFHIGALNALTIRVLIRGGRTLIRRAFDPRQTLADIEAYSVQQAFLVPAMLGVMQQADNFKSADISSLRALICAGAPVPPSLLTQYEDKQIKVQQAWGLTETAPFATYLPSEMTFTKPGSCGIPMPFTQVKVVDANGQDVSDPGVSGELWVKGPNVTSGYWENPQATEGAFEDGWFKTGDIGYQDEDGFFFIVDRLKDMIISGGENIYPAEVERVLASYPGITDVAVVGVEDEKWGEIVVAVIVPENGAEITVERVRDFASEHLARYKLPKEIVLSQELYRNGSGKLLKGQIRKLAAEEVGRHE